MIKDKKEALEFCAKYGVELKKHKTVIVTASGNIYLSDNIDPKDLGEVFYLKGERANEVVEPKKEESKASEIIEPIKLKKSKKLKDGESNDNI